MAKIELSSGVVFSSEPGESILNAATRAHVSLAYSCKTGRCSSCKSQVLSGDTVSLQEETGLSAQEKEAGWVLSCVRSAVSDVTLEVEDLGGVELPAEKTLPCRIHSIEKLTSDVVSVKLRLPPTSDFRFLPGQYIDVIGSGGLRRSYSLANSHAAGKMLELYIREVDGGAMSQYWFNDAKPNDLLRLNGPLGTFFLRDARDADVVFLATGTGIAPIRSILEGLASADPATHPRSISVYWGNRTESDLYQIPAISPAVRFIPVLSRPDASWTGACGYVQDVLIERQPELLNTVVYACGSPAMIQSAKELLLQRGLSEKRFYSDAFVCSAA